MHKLRFHILGLLVTFTLAAGGVFAFTHRPSDVVEEPQAPGMTILGDEPASTDKNPEPKITDRIPGAVLAKDTATRAAFGFPISHARERVNKKPFGMYITPETSPVPNDRFTGFHVGTDFETAEDEQDVDVPIFAICDGPLLFKVHAKGYGGLAVQSCELKGEKVQVLYGHVRLESVTPEAGDLLTKGQRIAVLGTGHSEETDGVRKHLHLGIHTGEELDVHGYVKEEGEVGTFLNALDYMPQ